MKIEVGESLCYSYLRHVKRCWLVQTNWKTSEHWPTQKPDSELEDMLRAMRKAFDPEGSVLKKTVSAGQFMQQGEIDVIGVDQNGTVHAIDIAFHEQGLNYSGENVDRVLKKVLRTYLLLYAYHPAGTKYHVYFVSPKVGPGTQAELEAAFEDLRSTYPETSWHLITNAAFSVSVLNETLALTETVADSSELFARSAKLLNLSRTFEVKELDATSVYSKPSESKRSARADFQPLVRALMRTLLEECPTILDHEILSNLTDAEYCKENLRLRIGNRPLIRERREGRMVRGSNRYWKDLYAGKYYVCSEWWRDDHLDNARSLLRFLEVLALRNPQSPEIGALDGHIEELRNYIAGK